ncbi:SsgA family sporulation/cell division regulator [Streptomyces sp. NBC_01216]|uniref:SsgA family sporulation/cell division regulator n=1 Tax=unclassified Streptomyces TaxID=2593676 RepID=UPI002E12BC96|nr:SsgA family sporulation/cell division regulator [Streptomyces sp. NBC_01216]
MPTVIEQAVQARLVASAPRMETVPAMLRYDRGDPYAVSMIFPPRATLVDVEVAWAFSRELLVQGVEGPAGEGDVRVRPYGYDRTVVEFHATEGVAVVHIRTEELRRFLERAQHLVPSGREHHYLDWDQDLAQLLDGYT